MDCGPGWPSTPCPFPGPHAPPGSPLSLGQLGACSGNTGFCGGSTCQGGCTAGSSQFTGLRGNRTPRKGTLRVGSHRGRVTSWRSGQPQADPSPWGKDTEWRPPGCPRRVLSSGTPRRCLRTGLEEGYGSPGHRGGLPSFSGSPLGGRQQQQEALEGLFWQLTGQVLLHLLPSPPGFCDVMWPVTSDPTAPWQPKYTAPREC